MPLLAFQHRCFPPPAVSRDGDRRAALAPYRPRGPRPMRKELPDPMFADPDTSRLTMLRSWVLDNCVTEIDMKERQFWNFAALQPPAEKPWTTFIGRVVTCRTCRKTRGRSSAFSTRTRTGMIGPSRTRRKYSRRRSLPCCEGTKKIPFRNLPRFSSRRTSSRSKRRSAVSRVRSRTGPQSMRRGRRCGRPFRRVRFADPPAP